MDRRARLRDEIAYSAGLSMDALIGPPGAQPEQALAGASHLVDSAERALHQLVAEAREAGMSWAAIGEILGISRQAAQKRFAGHVPAKVTRDLPSVPDWALDRALTLFDAAASGRFEELEAAAGPSLLRLAESTGLAPIFAPVRTIYGDLISRGEPEAQVIGTVVRVTSPEQRTLRPTVAQLVLGPDQKLLGLTYHDAPTTKDEPAEQDRPSMR